MLLPYTFFLLISQNTSTRCWLLCLWEYTAKRYMTWWWWRWLLDMVTTHNSTTGVRYSRAPKATGHNTVNVLTQQQQAKLKRKDFLWASIHSRLARRWMAFYYLNSLCFNYTCILSSAIKSHNCPKHLVVSYFLSWQKSGFAWCVSWIAIDYMTIHQSQKRNGRCEKWKWWRSCWSAGQSVLKYSASMPVILWTVLSRVLTQTNKQTSIVCTFLTGQSD